MPRCEEPWYEARFENPKEGQAQVIVTELQKLGAKPTAKLADLGSPDQVRWRWGSAWAGLGQAAVLGTQDGTGGLGMLWGGSLVDFCFVWA
jgi:hypothetical protein